MATGDLPSGGEPEEPADLRSSARRALDFERVYLRRRWAAYYAAWALAFVMFLAVPHLAGSAIAAAVGTLGALLMFAALDVAAIVLAVPISAVIAHRGDRTYELRGALVGGGAAASAETLLRVVIIAIAVVGLLTGAILFGLASVWTIVVPVFVFIFLTYRNLARSFRPIPAEGWAAVASFLVANTLTLVGPWSALLAGLAILAWGIAFGIWAVCAGFAWYAFAPVPEEHG